MPICKNCNNFTYKEENEKLKDALHRDQTGLAKALSDVLKEQERYCFLYYSPDEVEATMRDVSSMRNNIENIVTTALRASGNTAHTLCCGRPISENPTEGLPLFPAIKRDTELATALTELAQVKATLAEQTSTYERAMKVWGQMNDMRERKIGEMNNEIDDLSRKLSRIKNEIANL